MNAEESKNRIQWLRAEVTRHDTAYYGGAPTISDREYDLLYAELRQLEDTYPQFLSVASPSFKVGCEPTGAEFEEISHSVPMLSVDNVFDESGIMQWHHTVCRTITEPRYAVEYKLDGMSLALYYVNGLLTVALTRGNGQVGQFVFPQACTIRNLPLQLQPLRTAPRGIFEVRGEVCMKESEFAAYQARCAVAGEAIPANPRNAAVGAMRQKDSRLTRQRPLAFIAHSYGQIDHLPAVDIMTHSAVMDTCQRYGIMTVLHRGRDLSIDGVLAHVQFMIAEAATLDLPTDGIVIKLELQKHRDMLGAGPKYPKWAIAYKWEKFEAETFVNDITVQVGKHGMLTPVAELEPVTIAGTVVSRASLFNQDEINRLGVGIGARVLIEKAGKIIPHVVRTVFDSARQYAVYTLPATCPDCGTQVVREGTATICPNPECPAQLLASLCSAVSKPNLNIAGMGPTLVEQLVAAGVLTCLGDLYTLHEKEDQITAIRGVSSAKFRRICDSVGGSKLLPSWKQLAAWNIRHCGATVSETLLRRIGSIQSLASMSVDELQAMPGVGSVIAESLAAYFNSESGGRLLAAVLRERVNLGANDPVSNSTERPLDGLKVVPTGELQQWDRDQIKTVIRDLGGIPTSSVSAKTNLILAGTDPGPKKLAKAAELGIRVISETDFVILMQTGQLPPEGSSGSN